MQPAAASPPVRFPVGRASFASLALRWTRLTAGLLVFAAGLALTVRADLGLSSWDVLHDGITRLAPLSFGSAIVLVSLVVVGASYLLGVRPGPATVANMFLVGIFIDALLSTGALSGVHDAGPVPRTLAFAAGVAAIAFGTALYIGARLGAGPRDSLMLGVSSRSGTSPGVARTAIELSVLLAGIAIGGSAGVGTVAFALAIGPSIDLAFGLLGMDVTRRGGPSLRARLAGWLRGGRLGPPADLAAARYTGARR